MPDIDATLATIERVASAPTAPYHEFRALRAIRGELERNGLSVSEDAYGQLAARSHRGNAKRALALVAHTDVDDTHSYALDLRAQFGRKLRA